MKLSDLIIEYRAEHLLSQRQFAARCGLSNGYISMLEKGLNPKTGKPVTPTLHQLKKLADGMSISVSAMLEQIDDMPVDLTADPSPSSGENKEPAPEGLTEAQQEAMQLIDSMTDDQLRAFIQAARAFLGD